jgi:hypothetical protein
VHAIGVEVEDFQPSGVVDVEQDKRRAADRMRIAAESFDDAAGELRFAGAQVADERDAFAAGEGSRDFRRDLLGLADGP